MGVFENCTDYFYVAQKIVVDKGVLKEGMEIENNCICFQISFVLSASRYAYS